MSARTSRLDLLISEMRAKILGSTDLVSVLLTQAYLMGCYIPNVELEC